LGLIVVLAAAAPIAFPGDPWETVGDPFTQPFTGPQLLGTDALGRDVLAGIVHGARVSLLIGLVSTFAAVVVGVLLGSVAGYRAGWLDEAITFMTEFFQIIPTFIFAILIVAISRPSIVSIVAAISTISWPPVARTVRSEVMALRQCEYVQAAIVLGSSNARVIFREILPNVISPIIVSASLMIATAILMESSISFLGLGDPNAMSWGYMVGASRTVIREGWWTGVFPGLAIMLTVLAINLVGDGLDDAFNPRRAKRRRG